MKEFRSSLVCLYMYAYVYVYVCMYVYMYVCMYVCVYMYMYIYGYIYMCVYLSKWVGKRIFLASRVCMCVRYRGGDGGRDGLGYDGRDTEFSYRCIPDIYIHV